MDTGFNNCHKVSFRLSRILLHHFLQEIRTIEGIKSPPKHSPQGDKNRNPYIYIYIYPNLKDTPKTKANLKVTRRWFTRRLCGTFCYFYQNWACILCAFMDIYVLTDAVHTLYLLSFSTRRIFHSISQCYRVQLEKYTKLLETLWTSIIAV